MNDTELGESIASTHGTRVTKEGLEALIVGAEYHRLTAVLTVCLITTVTGFTVTGESACVDPANYDQQIGEKIAFDNAFAKLWPLEGYLLKYRQAHLADQAAEARIAALDAEAQPQLDVSGMTRLTSREVAAITYEAVCRFLERQGHNSLTGWGDASERTRDEIEVRVVTYLDGNMPDTDLPAVGVALERAIVGALRPVTDPDATVLDRYARGKPEPAPITA